MRNIHIKMKNNVSPSQRKMAEFRKKHKLCTIQRDRAFLSPTLPHTTSVQFGLPEHQISVCKKVTRKVVSFGSMSPDANLNRVQFGPIGHTRSSNYKESPYNEKDLKSFETSNLKQLSGLKLGNDLESPQTFIEKNKMKYTSNIAKVKRIKFAINRGETCLNSAKFLVQDEKIKELQKEVAHLQANNKSLVEQNESIQSKYRIESQYNSLYMSLINKNLEGSSQKNKTISEILGTLKVLKKEDAKKTEAIKIKEYEEKISALNEQITGLKNLCEEHKSRIEEDGKISEENSHLQKKLEKTIAKYKSIKKESKKLQEFNSDLKEEIIHLNKKISDLDQTIELKATIISGFTKEKEINTKRIKELEKQLYKFESNNDVCSLHPYEMHQRMRYFESMYELTNNNYNQAQNFIDELNHYLYRVGLTFDHLKEASRKGKLEVETYSFSNNLKSQIKDKEKVKERRLSENQPKKSSKSSITRFETMKSTEDSILNIKKLKNHTEEIQGRRFTKSNKEDVLREDYEAKIPIDFQI
ncbi:unnamed protein product [Moneuplotes crassus]|uniref:Uncharacterized protein n=1 Tax=Euplotes crassus TaxID=5936 RepID=A0AAD1U582_EUPCR|nr:unnamed protein product [Moneuplotes crassus]